MRDWVASGANVKDNDPEQAYQKGRNHGWSKPARALFGGGGGVENLWRDISRVLLANLRFRHSERLHHNKAMITGRAKILVVDNYDSFVFNLVQYLAQIGAECTVLRNDEVDVAAASNFDGVLISPGPGIPETAGISVDLVKYCAVKKISLLGVCLGHQAIGVAFGATVSRAPELLHGKTSTVLHNGAGLFTDIPSPFTATRYHSLAIEVDTVPGELEVTAKTDSGVIMAVQHKTLPIAGVQFHPESVLTEHGHQLLGNWLEICGDTGARKRSEGLSPVVNRK
jgi:para-aminobenzoate synthetase component II